MAETRLLTPPPEKLTGPSVDLPCIKLRNTDVVARINEIESLKIPFSNGFDSINECYKYFPEPVLHALNQTVDFWSPLCERSEFFKTNKTIAEELGGHIPSAGRGAIKHLDKTLENTGAYNGLNRAQSRTIWKYIVNYDLVIPSITLLKEEATTLKEVCQYVDQCMESYKPGEFKNEWRRTESKRLFVEICLQGLQHCSKINDINCAKEIDALIRAVPKDTGGNGCIDSQFSITINNIAETLCSPADEFFTFETIREGHQKCYNDTLSTRLYMFFNFFIGLDDLFVADESAAKASPLRTQSKSPAPEPPEPTDERVAEDGSCFGDNHSQETGEKSQENQLQELESEYTERQNKTEVELNRMKEERDKLKQKLTALNNNIKDLRKRKAVELKDYTEKCNALRSQMKGNVIELGEKEPLQEVRTTQSETHGRKRAGSDISPDTTSKKPRCGKPKEADIPTEAEKIQVLPESSNGTQTYYNLRLRANKT